MKFREAKLKKRIFNSPQNFCFKFTATKISKDSLMMYWIRMFGTSSTSLLLFYSSRFIFALSEVRQFLNYTFPLWNRLTRIWLQMCSACHVKLVLEPLTKAIIMLIHGYLMFIHIIPNFMLWCLRNSDWKNDFGLNCWWINTRGSHRWNGVGDKTKLICWTPKLYYICRGREQSLLKLYVYIFWAGRGSPADVTPK